MRNNLNEYAKSYIKKMINSLPDPLNIIPGIFRAFKQTQGYYPNIFFPQAFNEKIQKRKIFDRRRILTLIADKYAVRDYVTQKTCADILTKLYFVTDNPSEIHLESLPRRFVVKPTHGSGWIYIVKDKNLVNKIDLVKICSGWLSQSFYELTKQWVYKDIPRRIIIEEFLDDGTGEPPMDYKLFVFSGKVELIQVDIDRFTKHRRNIYDVKWNRIDVRLLYDNYDGSVPRPDGLNDMIKYAETLGKELDFIRVDFYNYGNRVVFGELTNTPENGFGIFYPVSFDYYLGTLWKMQL